MKPNGKWSFFKALLSLYVGTNYDLLEMQTDFFSRSLTQVKLFFVRGTRETSTFSQQVVGNHTILRRNGKNTR